MFRRPQNGIFYEKKASVPISNWSSSKTALVSPNDTFAIVFLRVKRDHTLQSIKASLARLWSMYRSLEKGYVKELLNQRFQNGGLSVLIGYGQSIFGIEGIKRRIPNDFVDARFLEAREGDSILENSGLRYSSHMPENVGLTEDIAIQFISNAQLTTYRPVVETWKHLKTCSDEQPLVMTKFFTGFQRNDGRGWLGFHDELSNLKPGKERKGAIFIDRWNNTLRHSDMWTVGGTYLAFLRIEIDLELWDKIDRHHQELIVGRNKISGTPIIGVTKKGTPLYKQVRSAGQITTYNSNFHDHPDYFKRPRVPNRHRKNLDVEKSFKLLNQSHIGRTRHIDQIDSDDPVSRRIYRQGFEFIEPLSNGSENNFRVGLNFVSFQNDPSRLLFMLTDSNWLGNANFGGDIKDTASNQLLSVLATGIFFVPPKESLFPGSSLFETN